ncbi:hypothetical protein ABHI18_012667 [Aspergillus niger]
MEIAMADGYDSGVEIDDIHFISVDHTLSDRVYNHGRYYQASNLGRHPFPIDEREKERQCRQFAACHQLFQGRTSLTSIGNLRTVLDIKAGAGNWAIQFAEENPSSVVYGIDNVPMQEEWVPSNCEFLIDDLVETDWYSPFLGVDFIHIGELRGDYDLLTSILDGAYRCCSPGGSIEIWDNTLKFHDPNGASALHRLWRDMDNAYSMDGRSLNLPLMYPEEIERFGFVNVVETAYHLPLNLSFPDPATQLVASWADGLEAYGTELLSRHLGKHHFQILIECAAARQAIRQGVEGWLQM